MPSSRPSSCRRGEQLDRTFDRFEFALERLSGYLNSLTRDLKQGADLEIGPMLPLDERLSAYNVGAHVSDDLFANKLAFVALLNFPLTTLDERMTQGMSWTRRQWAEARLAGQFQTRVPADVVARQTEAYAAADNYIAGYNIYMHHVLTPDGRRLFPPGHAPAQPLEPARRAEGPLLRSRWPRAPAVDRARDGEDRPPGDPGGRGRQPPARLDARDRRRRPLTREGRRAPAGATATPSTAPEDERYRRWLDIFAAERLVDAHTPDNPTLIDRRFNVNREIPEAQVQALFAAVLDSPLAARVAKLIQKRLGRTLQPFDIWYSGFRPRGRFSEAELDAITKQRYPNAAAYAADMPRLFHELGFSEERARFLADRIVVDPARGSGHALGATRRDDEAHLRTRVGKDGMDYKGYNIAVHEMGHNVEQVFSVSTDRPHPAAGRSQHGLHRGDGLRVPGA